MANGIDFLLSLKDQFSAPLGKAEAAVSRLANQLNVENQALARVEQKAQDAAAKLAAMKVNPTGIADLERRFDAAAGKARALYAQGDQKGWNKAATEAAGIQAKLNAAREKQGEAVKKQEAVTKGLREQVATQQQSRNALQSALPQWQKWSQSLGANGDKLSGLADQAIAAGGPLGALASKGKALVGIFGKAGVAGAAVAVAAALFAVAAAAAYATIAFLSYALSAADAARSSRLLADAATGSAAGGKELEAVVSQLNSTIPQAREKTAQWARELSLARIQGRDMQRTLTTMGIVAAAVGDSGAAKIRGIAESSRQARRFMLGARDAFGEFAGLEGTGIKAADIYAALADSMKVSIGEATRLVKSGTVPVKKGLEALEKAAQAKFGAIVEKQMMSLPVIAAKFEESFAALFSGVNIEPFLKGLKSIADLFDENTVMGHAIKTVLGEALTFVFDKASVVFPYIRAFMLGLALGAVVLATVIKRIANTISKALGLDAKKSLIDVETAFKAGALAVALVTGAILGLAAVWLVNMAAMAISAIIAWAPMILGAAILGLVVYGLYKVSKAAGELWDELKEVDLAQIASDLIDGLIKGITGKIADVKKAVLSVADAISSAFTGDEGMKIRSPSRVAMKWGEHIDEGIAGGVDNKAEMVQASVNDMAPGAPEGSRTVRGRSGNVYNLGPFYLSGRPDESAKREWDAFFEARMMAFERGIA